MSSTNRGNARHFHISDYYITPIEVISNFLTQFLEDERRFKNTIKILDPCAGGQKEEIPTYPFYKIISNMSYPQVLKEHGFLNIDTCDIRNDSLADYQYNYLLHDFKNKYDVIITNPPFGIALDIIQKALNDVKENGYVIMLERLNFLESKKRKLFWETNMPKYIYVNSGRVSFTNDGKSDSIVYAHFVWQKGIKNKFSLTRVI